MINAANGNTSAPIHWNGRYRLDTSTSPAPTAAMQEATENRPRRSPWSVTSRKYSPTAWVATARPPGSISTARDGAA